MVSWFSEALLPDDCGGVAFDGCRCVLPVRGRCAAAVLDSALCFVRHIRTCRPYGAIAYDSRRDCFWATSAECWSAVFRLDCRLREVDCFRPRLPGCLPRPISGVAVCGDRLLVTWGNKLLEADPVSGSARLLWEGERGAALLAAACRGEEILLAVCGANGQRLVLLDENGTVLAEEALVDCPIVRALLPWGRGLLLLGGRELLRAVFAPARQEDLECWQAPSFWEEPLIQAAALSAAVARSLEAYGEDLRKALCDGDLDDCLEADHAVGEAVGLAVRLELVLLEILREICCFW